MAIAPEEVCRSGLSDRGELAALAPPWVLAI
jgi:hypothetical protein